jgi:hypothetical protein
MLKEEIEGNAGEKELRCKLDPEHQLVRCRGDGSDQSGKVVRINSPVNRIFRGQPAFTLGKTHGARWGRVPGLQLDGAVVDAVEPNQPTVKGIDVELDFECPKGANLFALSKDDDVVWSPLEPVAAPTTSAR